MKRITATAATISLSLAAALGLSACANPLDSLIENAVGGGIENLIENELGEDVDISIPGASGASLPSSWPDVPTPQGEVLFSVATGGTWTATIQVSSVGAIESVFNDLELEGYELTSESNFGGLISRIYENDTYTVTAGVISEEGDDTIAVQYAIGEKTP